jgi:hypothetical protein
LQQLRPAVGGDVTPAVYGFASTVGSAFRPVLTKISIFITPKTSISHFGQFFHQIRQEPKPISDDNRVRELKAFTRAHRKELYDKILAAQ